MIIIKRTLSILLFNLAIHTVFGQIDSNSVFKAAKGSWSIPIDEVKEITTYAEVTKSMRGDPNPGISFTSEKGGFVRSVFDGRVIAIEHFHDEIFILVKYGDYFVSYVGLKTVLVKQSDFLKRGQYIGTILVHDDGIFELEILLNTSKNLSLDPEPWFGTSLNGCSRKKF